MTALADSLRSLRRSRAFAMWAVSLLASGLACNIASFVLLHAVHRRPVGLVSPDEVLVVSQRNPELGGQGAVAPATFLALGSQATAFDAIAAYQSVQATDNTTPTPRRISVARITPDFFDVVEVSPEAGRSFTEADATARSPLSLSYNRLAIVSHAFWRGRKGTPPDIIGSSLSLDDQEYMIVGVMPPGFDFPDGTDVWIPLAIGGAASRDWGTFSLRALARLKRNVTVAHAQADTNRVARLLQDSVWINRGMTIPVVTLRESLFGDFSQALGYVFGLTLVMLLVLCSTFVTLLISRWSNRRNDVAIQLALGASRWAVLRQIVYEVGLIAWLATLLGLLVAPSIIRSVILLIPVRYIEGAARIDVVMVVYGFAIATAIALLTGVVAATALLQRPELIGVAPRRSTTANKAQQLWNGASLAIQIAMAISLVHGALLLTRSYERLQNIDLGFEPSSLFIMDMALPPQRYPTDEARVHFVEHTMGELGRLRGVEVAAAVRLPMISPGGGIWFETKTESQAAKQLGVEAVFNPITAGYFSVMRIAVKEGRGITVEDQRSSEPVAVVNEHFAKRFLGTPPRIGQKIVLTPWPETARTIVGIVADVPYGGPRSAPGPAIYVPYPQIPAQTLHIVVRSHAGWPGAVEVLRHRTGMIDKRLALGQTSAMAERLRDVVAPERLTMWLVHGFAWLALAFAAAGTYGLTATSVSQERRAIGVRFALGAQPSAVFSLLFVSHGRYVLAGAVLGCIVATILTQAGSIVLVGSERDHLLHLFLSVLLLLGASGLAACLGARRVIGVAPAQLLRGE